jgi:hypothetical protein
MSGVAVLSNLTTRTFGTKLRLILVLALLTIIFWGNVFRFYPRLIDGTYDTTSEALVVGRLARSAADGLMSQNADLGQNVDPNRLGAGVSELYNDQNVYFSNPRLVDSLHLIWLAYPNQFGLQGIVFSIVDLINPLPRAWRIGFYHLLASLMSAGALVWIADILRRRFGWAAFCGFLIPPAIEPMFTALGPNLYWVVGTWLFPMAIAMYLADEENSRRRLYLVAAAFACFLVKSLCGYEFVSTVILAAATGCLLGTKEIPDRLARNISNVAWILAAGIAGFAVAVAAHAAKLGGFAVIADRAGARIAGDSSLLKDQLLLGKFASFQTVLLRYLEGNDVTLIKSFGLPFGLFLLVAILALMDREIIWYLGNDRRKLHILALAFLASVVAPLSWFVLAKAHAFVHPPIDFILWYVPTIPLGGALIGVALAQTFENRSVWRTSVARSAITIAIPTLIILTSGAIFMFDRLLQSERAWVLTVHSKAMPLFESEDLGIELRMTDQWFTVQYECGVAASNDSFFIHAYEGGVLTKYDFKLADKLIYASKNRCFYARAKADRPFTRITFGPMSGQNTLWENEKLISIPDTFTLEQVTDAEWDHGVNRSSGTELLLRTDIFDRLFLKKGDRVQLPASDWRTIMAVSYDGPHEIYKKLSIDGAPVKAVDVGISPIRIIRQ